MNLNDVGDILLTSPAKRFKNHQIDINKLDPETVFKDHDRFNLSYSTISQHKECKLKFFARNILGLSFFKVGEALFLGNLIHKFVEVLTSRYKVTFTDQELKYLSGQVYNALKTLFNKDSYTNVEAFCESVYKEVMSKKKFNPDIFFDDLSYISTIYSYKTNYVELNRELFLNAYNIVKKLVKVASFVGSDQFFSEKWVRFDIENLPVTFIGKIDLYFLSSPTFEKELIFLTDFKTGNKKYFNWDQLDYYSIYFGKDKYDSVVRYILSVKDNECIKGKKPAPYDTVLNSLTTSCKSICDDYAIFKDMSDKLKDKYSKLVNQTMASTGITELHRVPVILTTGLLDIFVTDFINKLKSKCKIPSPGAFCQFCDIYSFCNIKRK